MNPSWHQGKLREFCKQKGIQVSAWSPLGAYKVFWGSSAVMENPILQEIAVARNKSVAQVQLITFETILANKVLTRLTKLEFPFAIAKSIGYHMVRL